MFLQIGLEKDPTLSPSHCPNSTLSILTIGTPIAYRISEYGHRLPSCWTQIAVSGDKLEATNFTLAALNLANDSHSKVTARILSAAVGCGPEEAS